MAVFINSDNRGSSNSNGLFGYSITGKLLTKGKWKCFAFPGNSLHIIYLTCKKMHAPLIQITVAGIFFLQSYLEIHDLSEPFALIEGWRAFQVGLGGRHDTTCATKPIRLPHLPLFPCSFWPTTDLSHSLFKLWWPLPWKAGNTSWKYLYRVSHTTFPQTWFRKNLSFFGSLWQQKYTFNILWWMKESGIKTVNFTSRIVVCELGSCPVIWWLGWKAFEPSYHFKDHDIWFLSYTFFQDKISSNGEAIELRVVTLHLNHESIKFRLL